MIGVSLPVDTPIGTRSVTLLSNMNVITASYTENEETIDIKSTKNSAGSGVISVIMPKEVVTSIGSTASNIKLRDNGKDAIYTIHEFPEIYLIKIAQNQGEHKVSLYLNGYPSFPIIIPVYLAVSIALTLILYVIVMKKRVR